MPSLTAVSQPTTSTSMIIRTGHAGIEVDSLDVAIARVRTLAQRVGGFVANTAVQGGDDQLRSASLEVKIPSERFDEALAGLTPIGKVESVNVNAQDVGEEYVDIAARVENAHRLEARLIDAPRESHRQAAGRACPSSASSRACARRSSATRAACASCARASP